MRPAADRFQLSASDLANHLGCHHLTQLDLAVAKGNLAPPKWRDPALEVLQERGLALEQAYLDHLRRQGCRIAELGPDEDGSALKRTNSAMRGGAQADVRRDDAGGRALALDPDHRIRAPPDGGPSTRSSITIRGRSRPPDDPLKPLPSSNASPL